MRPTTKIAETATPDGTTFRLYAHDGEFFLYMEDRQVMSTTLTHSELLLADIGCDFRDRKKNPRILIGGLGLGYSLRRCLELTGSGSIIEVAELLPEIVRWNRECLDGLNDELLNDPRTRIVEDDVYACIRDAAESSSCYDAILLDVDDGPSSLIQSQNVQIYRHEGLLAIKRALNPGGRAAFWTAIAEPGLLRDLRRAGFRTEEISVAKHPRARRKNHCIYLAERRD
jgi:spermidine synthase